MAIITLVSLAFGLFMAWTTWGEWQFTNDPLGFGPWGHFFLTVVMAVGSVATIVTAVRVAFF